MKTKFCPRCKEQRMIEWFGEPHAPYAICLSCRVEVNGERKTQKQEKRNNFSRNCAICEHAMLERTGETCSRCNEILRLANNSPRLLSRAASFVGGALRQPSKKHKARQLRRKNKKLAELVKEQRGDAHDRWVRFDHAISK